MSGVPQCCGIHRVLTSPSQHQQRCHHQRPPTLSHLWFTLAGKCLNGVQSVSTATVTRRRPQASHVSSQFRTVSRTSRSRKLTASLRRAQTSGH